MSKWTLESIKNCVKFGDFVSKNGDDYTRRIVIKIGDDGSFCTKLNDYPVDAYDHWDAFYLNKLNFKFYRNGEEILPPKERELIKFTEKLVDSKIDFISDKEEAVILGMDGLLLVKRLGACLIEEIPNARVLYRYADDLTISHFGEK